MVIILKGRVPSKKNSRKIFVRNGKIVNIPSQDYKDWHDEMSWELKKYKRQVFYPKNKITLTFYSGDKRKFDLTNKAESVMDLLVDNEFIDDDNYDIVPEICLRFGGIAKRCASVSIVIEQGY